MRVRCISGPAVCERDDGCTLVGQVGVTRQHSAAGAAPHLDPRRISTRSRAAAAQCYCNRVSGANPPPADCQQMIDVAGTRRLMRDKWMSDIRTQSRRLCVSSLCSLARHHSACPARAAGWPALSRPPGELLPRMGWGRDEDKLAGERARRGRTGCGGTAWNGMGWDGMGFGWDRMGYDVMG